MFGLFFVVALLIYHINFYRPLYHISHPLYHISHPLYHISHPLCHISHPLCHINHPLNCRTYTCIFILFISGIFNVLAR